MQVLDFARSMILWRIDLDVLPPGTLSHRPPYPMNNSRIQIESRCRVVDKETGRTQTFVLGASCKTERVGAERDLFLEPNADFMPIISDDAFMHLKTFARRGTARAKFPPGSGDQPDRLRVPIKGNYVSMVLDLVEREGEPLADAQAICEATLANETLVASTTIRHGRYEADDRVPGEDDERERARMGLPDRHGPGALPGPRRTARAAARAARHRVRGAQRSGTGRSSSSAGPRRSRMGSRSTTTTCRSASTTSTTSSTASHPTRPRRPAVST